MISLCWIPKDLRLIKVQGYQALILVAVAVLHRVLVVQVQQVQQLQLQQHHLVPSPIHHARLQFKTIRS